MASSSLVQKKHHSTAATIYCGENSLSDPEKDCDFTCLQIKDFHKHLRDRHKKQLNMVEQQFKDQYGNMKPSKMCPYFYKI